MSLRDIINMLQTQNINSENENIKIAKGEYKYPYSVREIYRMQKRNFGRQKRHLKHRKNG